MGKVLFLSNAFFLAFFSWVGVGQCGSVFCPSIPQPLQRSSMACLCAVYAVAALRPARPQLCLSVCALPMQLVLCFTTVCAVAALCSARRQLL